MRARFAACVPPTPSVPPIALRLLCPALLCFAAYGKTRRVRGAHALMGAGTAVSVFATWMSLTWSRQALPGPRNVRAQLRTMALLLSRQARLFKAGLFWSAPIFLGAGWLVGLASGCARGKQLDERRARMERRLVELGD